MDLPLVLDDHQLPIYEQLYRELRAAIAEQRLSPGTKLPATRALAKQLGVSRGTVVEAYFRLENEGYLKSRHGSGTYISDRAPEEFLFAGPGSLPQRRTGTGEPGRAEKPERAGKVSAWARQVGAIPTVPRVPWSRELPLYPGIPAYELLPLTAWRRIYDEYLEYRGTNEILGYGEPTGYRPLRQAIAEHVNAARAVNCDPDQIIVTAGGQHALDLIGRVILDAGDVAMVENPGYRGARNAFRGAGADVTLIPVTERGFSIEAARANRPPSLIYVTPSHQYPLGSIMDLDRRRDLVSFADVAGAWVVEDDYDCEFRYGGRPLPALQGLSPSNVIYVGTFSKVLFPSLRIGFIVSPSDLVDVFRAAESLSIRQVATLEQAVLARFISTGQFAQHVRRIRGVYDQRRRHLHEELTRRLGGVVSVDLDEAGMHLVAHFNHPRDDAAVSVRCAAFGASAPPLSFFNEGPSTHSGLVLGYTGFPENAITQSVIAIEAALADFDVHPPSD